MKNSPLFVIPCYNEAENIESLLLELKSTYPNNDVVVVDDGSTDHSFFVASKHVAVLRHVVNLGIGASVQTGILYAANNGYTSAIQIDGDGQHPPEEIKKLLPGDQGPLPDLVIGSRFLENQGFKSTFFRRIGISWITVVLRVLYGSSVTDPTSGFRFYGPRAIRMFAAQYPMDFPEPISIGLALNEGLVIREVPVVMKARLKGVSSLRGLKNISYMIRVTFYIILSKIFASKEKR